MLPGAYNNNVHLFQTREHVAILNEMIHDHRLIPLDGRPHVGPQIRQWMGDSRGRWEGDTLVVDTSESQGRLQSIQRDDASRRTVHPGRCRHAPL